MASDKRRKSAAISGVGELVLQNGRQAGVRRPLTVPATFIGRNKNCDLRLNGNGIDALHCVLIFGPDGILLRDLDSNGGTFVNEKRIAQCELQNGDAVRIGSFQFRLELAPSALKGNDASADEMRESLRIQAAAVAAQQVALEEEESRLEKRKDALRQQEEQLAAHLAEKQRQVQVWSEYTMAERENLRKEKVEHENQLATSEAELHQAQQDLEKDQERLNLERQRIHKVYQRLRQRWQRQWAGQKEKYQKLAEQFETEARTLADRQTDLRARETTLARQTTTFTIEREAIQRQVHESRDALKKDQDLWRKRRSLEMAALDARRQDIEEMQVKITQARQLLMHDKATWSQQHNALQAELHGLNNRIMHQRMHIQEHEQKIAEVEGPCGSRDYLPVVASITAPFKPEAAPIECEVEVLPDNTPVPASNWHQRCADLDRLASELADQRALLVEQYKRLAEIQGAWQEERSRDAADLQTLAERIAADEQRLAERQQQSAAAEVLIQDRQAEIDVVRQEILVWRAQLKAREKFVQDEHAFEVHEIHQKDTYLREQLSKLAELRLRWNQRRQEEIDDLQANRARVAREQEETRADRAEFFAKVQKDAEEKRTMVENSLALEHYRQELFGRAKDPAAERRVERLRRRWLSLNAALIGSAKNERDHTKKEMARLEERHAQLVNQLAHLTQDETKLAEAQSIADEREAALNARQMYLEETIRRLERRAKSDEQPLVIHEDVDAIAHAVYQEDDARQKAA